MLFLCMGTWYIHALKTLNAPQSRSTDYWYKYTVVFIHISSPYVYARKIALLFSSSNVCVLLCGWPRGTGLRSHTFRRTLRSSDSFREVSFAKPEMYAALLLVSFRTASFLLSGIACISMILTSLSPFPAKLRYCLDVNVTALLATDLRV